MSEAKEQKLVPRWLKEIDLACKDEKDWEKDVENALKVYSGCNYIGSGDGKTRKDTFNILWSNIEVLRPSLYNSTPRPDIRRRFRDKDPLGKAIAELMERAITYTVDCADFDHVMTAAVLDELLPGRAVTRVRYSPTFVESEAAEGEEPEQEVGYEEVTFEQVQWDRFKHGPGDTWEDVTWISFEHRLTRDEVEDKFPEFVDVVQFDCTLDEEEKHSDDEDKTFDRCKVYEIWDKDKREVLFIAESYKDKPLSREKDPLELADFWPIPRPLMAIENSTSLMPVTEYSMYETLAKELEVVTNRIGKLVKAIRVRGVYDSTISEVEKIFDAGDNQFIPAEGVAALLERGGLEKAIWNLPVDKYATVLIQLYEYRNGLIQAIYEITGISDIVRGATDPNETLGAQQIKANFGTQRLQKRQREVQRYARDLIRLATEIICEKFSPETLEAMTGLDFPTLQEKQMAQMKLQMMMQQAQMTGQQPQVDPNLQQVLQKPSWEEIKQVITSDMMREYRVDIETDSTIQMQQQEDQRNITELLTGITNFMGQMGPAIQSGFVTVDVAKTMLLSAVRRFKLGREVEDAIEDIEPPQQQSDPEADKAKMEMQAKEAEFEMEQEAKQAELEIKRQEAQMKERIEAMKLEAAEREHAIEMEALDRKSEYETRQHMMKMEALNEQRQQSETV